MKRKKSTRAIKLNNWKKMIIIIEMIEAKFSNLFDGILFSWKSIFFLIIIIIKQTHRPIKRPKSQSVLNMENQPNQVIIS